MFVASQSTAIQMNSGSFISYHKLLQFTLPTIARNTSVVEARLAHSVLLYSPLLLNRPL